MKKTIDLSKDNLYYLLMTVLSIGFLVGMIHITNATAIDTNATAINTNDLNNAFNCITQKVNKSANFTLADAFVCYDNTLPGAQKYADKPYQNPDLNHLPKIQHVSAAYNPPTKTITNDKGFQQASPTKTITNDKGINKRHLPKPLPMIRDSNRRHLPKPSNMESS